MRKLLIIFTILLFAGFSASAQMQISGKVTNAETDEPIPGVSIVVKSDQTVGTTTDMDGNYSIEAPSDAETLVYSFVGMQTKEVAINGRTTIDVAMQPAVEEMEEVVVTALGISRERKTLGYSVQDISGEELTGANEDNLVNSLSGKISGVDITDASSAVGSSSRITIRGNASFGDNQPLFVIDGTPISNRTTNLWAGGGIDWGNLSSDVDPNSIKSITVLKGANAAALYGERATNGVVLITTKSGEEKGRNFSVDFSSKARWDEPGYWPEFQNEYGGGMRGSEYKYEQFLEDNPGSDLSYNEYAREHSYNYVDGEGGGVNDVNPINWGPRLDAGLKLDQWGGDDQPLVSYPDNYKKYFETGMNIENSMTISASGDLATGRLTITNQNTTGIRHYTDQKQNTVSASATITPTDKLTADVNATYLNKASDNLQGVGYQGFWLGVPWMQRNLNMDRVKELEDENEFIYPQSNNPFWSIKNNTNSMERNRLYGNANVNYELTDWLSAEARVGTDLYSEYRKSINVSENKNLQRQGKGGTFNQNQIYDQEINADMFLEFDKELDQFRVDGQVGANYREDRYKSMGMSASDLTVPDVFNISNVKGSPSTNMYDQKKVTNSVFFSANGSYNDYLFLGVTGRNDWSSTLPENNRSYFYPSVSLGFSLTDAFPIESNILNYAKLRGSWARVGKDTDPYQLHRTYSASTFGGTTLLDPTNTLPPVNLKPEQTTSYEFGGDFSFLDNRLDLDVTYYKQVTENQILAVPTSITTGYSSMRYNAGEIENNGIEISMNGQVLENPSGLNWNVSVNWAKNNNYVNELYQDLESYTISGGFGGAQTVGVPGEEWGQIYGLPFVKNEEGKKVVNEKGIPLTTSEATSLGDVTPDWTGGINNTFRYKNINLSFLVDAQMGGDFFSVTKWHSYYTGSYKNTVRGNIRETGFIPDAVIDDGSENPTTPYDERVAAQDYYQGAWMWNNHEYSILDASYVKLRELVLGYTFNANNIPWLQSVNVSLSGRNLAILYRDESTRKLGLDPEVSVGGGEGGLGFENFQRPTTRSYALNLRISF